MQPKLTADVPAAEAMVVEMVRATCPHCHTEHLVDVPVLDDDNLIRRCALQPRLLYRLPPLPRVPPPEVGVEVERVRVRRIRPRRPDGDPITVAHAHGVTTGDVAAKLGVTPSWLSGLLRTEAGAARVAAACAELIAERESAGQKQEQEEE
jgi:hypothetical protein